MYVMRLTYDFGGFDEGIVSSLKILTWSSLDNYS